MRDFTSGNEREKETERTLITQKRGSLQVALWTGRGRELKHCRGSDDDGQAMRLKVKKI